ncbi:MAG: hypothetical protein JWL70_1543 [Acidimicrobiia bacterium]|nr:hypothetical protein [Acidimicrobiia bacterium]
MTLPVDLAVAVLDDRQYCFVAHLVARKTWWRGEVVAVMNAQFIGAWDVAPRGHPNDGRLDVVHVDAAMSRRARWQARGRLSTGTYLPHPQIATRSVKEWTTVLADPLDVWLDGVRVAREVRQISVRCVPDAFHVVV